MGITEGVIIAIISAIGIILSAMIQSFRKENRSDHAKVVEIIIDSVDRIEKKIDKHISNPDLHETTVVPTVEEKVRKRSKKVAI